AAERGHDLVIIGSMRRSGNGIPLLGWSLSSARESGVGCDCRARREPACNSPVELIVDALAETIENRVQRGKLPRPDDIDRYVGLSDHGGRFADAPDERDLAEIAPGPDCFGGLPVAPRFGGAVHHDDECARSPALVGEDSATREYETRRDCVNSPEFGSRASSEERQRLVRLDPTVMAPAHGYLFLSPR